MPDSNAPGYPPGVEELFKFLWRQSCMFSAKWRLYQDLFAISDDLAVLNSTASGSFNLIEESLRNDMVMQIGRLTDPEETQKQQNISLARLVSALKNFCHQNLHDQWSADLEAIKKHVQPFTKIRNKTVGHTDLPTAFATEPNQEMAVSRSHVESALKLISELMNSINMHFAGSISKFDDVLVHGNGKDLLKYLRAGREHFKEMERSERLRIVGN